MAQVALSIYHCLKAAEDEEERTIAKLEHLIEDLGGIIPLVSPLHRVGILCA